MKELLNNRQQGSALLVSLVILLSLTIIALSSMNSTILDEKIVGNYRDKSLSRVLADTALREPEVWLQARRKRLDLEDKLCKDNSARCTGSSLWEKNILDWKDTGTVDAWWGDPSVSTWGSANELPLAYGTNGGTTYCAAKPNEKKYAASPLFIDDGNSDNNCLANISIPPTYIVEESSGGSGSSEIRSLEVSTGMLSTCSSKINNYFWQTTVQSSGSRDTTKSMVRVTYVKKC